MPEPRRALCLVLAFAALPLSAAAQTPNWRAIGTGDDRIYIDAASIVRTGNRVRYVRETRLPAPVAGYDRYGATEEMDCRARTVRTIEMYQKLGDRIVSRSPPIGEGLRPRAIRSGGSAERDLRAVCLNQWPR